MLSKESLHGNIQTLQDEVIVLRSARRARSPQKQISESSIDKFPVQGSGFVSTTKTRMRAEVQALARKHRTLRAARSMFEDSSVSTEAFAWHGILLAEPFSPSPAEESMEQICSLCGGSRSSLLVPSPVPDDHRHNFSKELVHLLQSRISVLEELLDKAKTEAEQAKLMQQECFVYKVRATDLENGLRLAQQTCQELMDAFKQQTDEFQHFIASVQDRLQLYGFQSSRIEVSLDNLVLATGAAAVSLVQQRAICKNIGDYTATAAAQSKVQTTEQLQHELAEERTKLRAAERKKNRRASVENHSELISQLEERLQEETASFRFIRSQSQVLESEKVAYDEALAARASELRDFQSEFGHAQSEFSEELKRKRLEIQEMERQRQARFEQEHEKLRKRFAAEAAKAEKALILREKTSRVEQRKQQEANSNASPSTIVQALHALNSGAILKKLSAKKRVWEERFVAVTPSEPAAPTALKWSSEIRYQSLGWRPTTVMLKDVLRISFGDEQLPPDMKYSDRPWNCFSIWLSGRSYFFWSPDDKVAQNFIVGLSSLCPFALPIQPRYVILHRAIKKLGLTSKDRAKVLLRAARRAAATTPGGKLRVRINSVASYRVFGESGELRKVTSFADLAELEDEDESEEDDQDSEGDDTLSQNSSQISMDQVSEVASQE